MRANMRENESQIFHVTKKKVFTHTMNESRCMYVFCFI